MVEIHGISEKVRLILKTLDRPNHVLLYMVPVGGFEAT